jgi:ketosteroid isomerase-like protein
MTEEAHDAEERLALVRKGYDALERGDWETVLSLIDPEIEVHSIPEGPDPDVYHGIAGLLENYRKTAEMFGEIHFVPDELIDAGEHVIAFGRLVGTGKASGAPVEASGAHVWTLRNNKAIRVRAFMTREQALEAAGLSDEPT